MTLQRANIGRLEERVGITLADRPYSIVDDCGSNADHLVQLWVRGIDGAFRAEAGAQAPPVWIARRFKWGPHTWPVHWSQLPHMPHVDCGAMAALSTVVMQWRGVIAFPVQLVLRFTPECTQSWAALWSGTGTSIQWCGATHAYHEATGTVSMDRQIQIWDPLGRFWLPVRKCPGYEGIVGLRSHHDPMFDVRVGGMHLRPAVWYELEETPHSPDLRGGLTHHQLKPPARFFGQRSREAA